MRTPFTSSRSEKSEPVLRARHRTVDDQQTVGTAAGLVNAADLPLASEEGVVRPILSIPEPRPDGRSLRGIAHPGLRAAAVKSLTSTMLCGFLLLMSRAASIA